MRPRSRRAPLDMDRCARYGPMHEIWVDTRPHPLYRYTPSLSLPVHTQHTTGHPSNVPSPNFACNSTTQVTQHPELTQTGMMLAVNCMRNCWTATSYTEYHRNGCTHAACSPGCRPLGSHSRLATIPSTTPRSLHRYKTLPARGPVGPTRYKTLPARGPVGPTRYKTLPARPKYPFSAHVETAGRVLYRFHQHQAEQGEKSHAPTPHLTPPRRPSPNFACNSTTQVT